MRQMTGLEVLLSNEGAANLMMFTYRISKLHIVQAIGL